MDVLALHDKNETGRMADGDSMNIATGDQTIPPSHGYIPGESEHGLTWVALYIMDPNRLAVFLSIPPIDFIKGHENTWDQVFTIDCSNGMCN